MLTEDVLMVIGVVLAVLALPSVVSAIADQRSPRAPAILVMIAGSLILLSIVYRPGSFGLSDVPDAFVRVAAALLR